ncbi:holin [Citrobacter sp. ku-bf4]|uniref:phage holin n=1 Tax=Citrobacter TaxID=544 RepID=UPI0019822852|nr:phage holin [Citrobacter amalonaticus]MBN6043619.1 holin [Citrobacter sp. ku-bf4]MBS0824996.1 holin [Citrobacter amalonaticus]
MSGAGNHHRHASSGGSALFWFRRFFDGYTPEQGAAIGITGSLLSGLLTNLYFKLKINIKACSAAECY